MHELLPETPLRHGHAISIDMAFSATLAHQRGLISDAEHKRILNLFSRAGLSMDHPLFDDDLLDKATKAILKTRDGKLRAAVPNPIGTCVFINDVSHKELCAALKKHKEICQTYPRKGEGIEAYVDASDTGYTDNNAEAVNNLTDAAKDAGSLNDKEINGGVVMNGQTNGHANGHTNGHANGHADGGKVQEKMANGHANGLMNGANRITNVAKA